MTGRRRGVRSLKNAGVYKNEETCILKIGGGFEWQ